MTPHCSSSPESYNQEITQVTVIKTQLKTVGLSDTGFVRADLKQDGRSKISFAGPEQWEEELPLRHHGLFHRVDVAQAGPPKTAFSLYKELLGRAGRENVALCGPSSPPRPLSSVWVREVLG